MKTLLLDQDIWDLCLDASRNIAVADDPYASAQDVASAARLFRGELYYNTAPGVPYWENILGFQPPVEFLRAQYAAAAMRVPGIVDAIAVITGWSGRHVTGQIRATNQDGVTVDVGF